MQDSPGAGGRDRRGVASSGSPPSSSPPPPARRCPGAGRVPGPAGSAAARGAGGDLQPVAAALARRTRGRPGARRLRRHRARGHRPPSRAASYVLADLDTGAVLAARAPHARERPASTLKILTSLVVVDRLSPDAMVEGTAADLRVDGSKAGIGPGRRATRCASSWRACCSAPATTRPRRWPGRSAGTPPRSTAMTATARQYGALDTRPATPSGLDGPGMASSAYDLAALFRVALTKPLFAQHDRDAHGPVPRLRRQARLHARQQRPVRAVVRGGDRGEVGVHRRGATHAGRARRSAASVGWSWR